MDHQPTEVIDQPSFNLNLNSGVIFVLNERTSQVRTPHESNTTYSLDRFTQILCDLKAMIPRPFISLVTRLLISYLHTRIHGAHFLLFSGKGMGSQCLLRSLRVVMVFGSKESTEGNQTMKCHCHWCKAPLPPEPSSKECLYVSQAFFFSCRSFRRHSFSSSFLACRTGGQDNNLTFTGTLPEWVITNCRIGFNCVAKEVRTSILMCIAFTIMVGLRSCIHTCTCNAQVTHFATAF